MNDKTSILERVETELDTMKLALAVSRKGAKQEPDDSDWDTMIQCYSEAVAALERIYWLAQIEKEKIDA
jgi:hypothetical protein